MHRLNRRTVVAGLAGALPATAGGSVPALASPDAELIALGDKLRVAWAAERLAWDAEPDGRPEEWDVSAGIVAEIEKTTATTLDGMRVKALAVSWCHCGEKFDEESFAGDYTTDTRIICSLLNNLLA